MDPLLTQVKAALKSTLGKQLTIKILESNAEQQPILTLGQQASFTVEVNARELKSSAGLLVPQLSSSGQPSVLFTPYVSVEIGQQLRHQGFCYADAAGNAWLYHLEAPLYILVEGRPRPPKAKLPAGTTAGRAFRKSGLRVLFHLLTEPGLVGQSYRAIGDRTGTPVATVGLIMLDLLQQGYLVGEEPRQLRRLDELIRRWVEGYGDTLRPRLPTLRYRWAARLPAADAWQHLLLSPDTWWGGEPAAHLLLDGYLQPEFFTLYSSATRPALMRQLRLVPDPLGSVEVRQPFDEHLGSTTPISHCVPPLLVYADLLLSGDARNREVAQKLYARYLQHST